MKEHHYTTNVRWIGNTGEGTTHYTGYKRDHQVSKSGGSVIECSSDPVFRGDALKFNPEELFLSSISSCHMLWYLHLCTDAKLKVISYTDDPQGTMIEDTDGGGQFTKVLLRPSITIAGSAVELESIAKDVHYLAHAKCFIARSCNFKIYIEPMIYFV